jgi:hypothetical protein
MERLIERGGLMGWQAGDDPGPGGEPGPGEPPPGLLAAFEHGGAWDTAAPSAGLAAALEAAAGPGGLYEGAEAASLVGIARQWTAVESWAGAGTLGALRAMTREDAQGRPLTRRRGDLPDGWDDNLNYQIAGALAMGPVSAGNLASLAWTLGLRLRGIGRLLADGTLTKPKAKLIVRTFEPLDEDEAARAEALILGQLKGRTWFQVERLAWRAALAVAPDVAERRRTAAERRRARVTLFREESGAAGLSGRDLPAAQALSGHASILARARQYEASGAFPDHTPATLQALAYLHLLNDITAHDAIAFARTATAQPPDRATRDEDDEDDEDWRGEDDGGANPPRNVQRHRDDDDGPGGDGVGDGPGDDGGPCDDGDRGNGGDPDDSGGPGHDDDPRDDGDPGDDGRPGHDSGPGVGDPGGGPGPGGGDPDDDSGPRHDSGPDDDGDSGGGDDEDDDDDAPGGAPVRPVVLPEVTAPLATLQKRAERPGETRLLGPLDPALTRDLAAAAARSTHSRWAVTIVDEHGHATGHGIARPGRGRRNNPQPPGLALCSLPAQVNITVTEILLTQLAAQPRPGAPPGDWELAPRTAGERDGPWALTLPGGWELTVRFDVVPTHACDHRYQVNRYEPGDRLRRLVQVRDHECTFPPCSRPAHESDFEHAVPYHQGGRTDACNAGARSRRCHQVKQMRGWKVTQPKPGWHEWTTPTGRTYVQEPWRYTA